MRRRAVLRTSALLGASLAVPTAGAHPEHGGDADPNESDSDVPAASDSPYGPLGSVDVPGAREAVVGERGEVAYVATMDGFAAVDVSDPADPAVLAACREIDTDERQSLEGIWDLRVQGDRLAVVGPADRSRGPRGVALFDVSEPADPAQVAFHPTEFAIHNADFAGDTVALTGTGLPESPLVLVDVADDDPVEVARWSPVDHDEAWAGVDRSLRPLHDIHLHDGLASLVYWDAGTWLVEVSDPTAPVVRSRIGTRSPADLRALSADQRRIEPQIPPGNHHYSQIGDGGDLLAVGAEAWATETRDGNRVGGPGGIDLYDISDPTAPTHRGHIAPPASPDQTIDGRFTTAHNFDIDGGRLYASWYFGGISIHDVTDPAEPEELARWRDRETAFWTAQLADGAVVASSARLTDFDPDLPATRAALYTFPDRPGTQQNPPALSGGQNTPNESSDSSGQADGDGPGFGLVGALAALGGGYLLARRGSDK
jgi:hypothetical protein